MVAQSLDKHDSICITGVGLAACLGLDAETVWQRVQQGECGIGPMTALETPLPAGKDGGQAPELPADYAPALPREARYLRWTIESAIRNAGVDLTAHDPGRVSIVLGTTLHGMRAGGKFLRSNDYADLSTFLAGDTLQLAASGLGIGGLATTTCSACSSSLGAIAIAVTLLERGDADIVIAGGYDTVSEYVYAGFNALRLVSDAPLRPFTRGRTGMKVAEGYGILVLERRADAIRRQGKPIAEIAGWGESADAFHLTRPHPDGNGAVAAMRAAIARAGIAPTQLDLIAAHATGTPENDASEAAAIAQLLGERSRETPVVGFKSHLGHTLGGAGAVELILSALSIRDGIIPPTANVERAEIEYDSIRVTHGSATRGAVRHTLNTSLGFGGANTCVVLRAPGATIDVPSVRSTTSHDVAITGIGVVVPGGIGNDAFISLLDSAPPCGRRTIEDAEFEHLINARRTRRMSPYVKLSLAAAMIAARDAGIADHPELLRAASALLGTTHGSAGYSYDYYSQLVREGIAAANPMLFAEGVPNAAAAQLSLMLGLTGACQTFIGTRTAGLDGLNLAAARIERGDADRIFVCAAEESHFTLDHAYKPCRDSDAARPTCSAAVAFIVESAEAAAARGATVYATIAEASAHTATGEPLSQLVRRTVRTAMADDEAHVLHRAPVALSGQAFSVEPLLALAGWLLRPVGSSATIAAADRTGTATAVRVTREIQSCATVCRVAVTDREAVASIQ